jgi:hypothetical protein
MSGERRYDHGEVEEILGRAVEERPSASLGAAKDGLTLSELQEVGREVGIPSARIEEAARTLDHAPRVDRTLGLPLKVGRTVPLPAAPTEAEWEALVSDLRATFGAAGKIHRDGNLRGWTNGNLHAWVEPDGGGYRLRMGTTKGSARQLGGVGAGMLGMSGVLGTLSVLTTEVPLAGAGALLAMGLGTLVAAVAGVPSWARRRLDQMDAVAGRLSQRIRSREEPPAGSS